MKISLILLFAALPASTISAQLRDTTHVDTLRQVEVRGDSVLRVNEAIRQSIGRENATRIGYPSVSDVLGPRITDKKHARDRKILQEYEEMDRVKTFEELLDEAIRKQAIEDGKEPPTRSGKK